MIRKATWDLELVPRAQKKTLLKETWMYLNWSDCTVGFDFVCMKRTEVCRLMEYGLHHVVTFLSSGPGRKSRLSWSYDFSLSLRLFQNKTVFSVIRSTWKKQSSEILEVTKPSVTPPGRDPRHVNFYCATFSLEWWRRWFHQKIKLGVELYSEDTCSDRAGKLI